MQTTINAQKSTAKTHLEAQFANYNLLEKVCLFKKLS